MKRFVALFVAGAGAAFFLLIAHAQQALRSPWDGNAVKLTGAPYECPAPVPLAADAAKAKPGGESQNNHLYWAGVEIGAIGIAANDRSLFDWAIATYRNGVRQVTPEGTLPLEMHRGQRALHYHLYAISRLYIWESLDRTTALTYGRRMILQSSGW